MNTITIKGRLAKDIDVKDTASGKVVSFLLADELRRNGEPVKDADGKTIVQYINCAAKGKAVEKAEALKKGNFVDGTGYLKVDTNEKDGKYYTNVTVWVNRFNEKKADAPADAKAAQ